MANNIEQRICFLRAINVGRMNRVPMGAFQAFFADIGMVRCTSYIQSGNFILAGRAELMNERLLAERLHSQLQVRTAVFLRTVAAYRHLIAACPYAEMAADHPKKLLVSFFGAPAAMEPIALLQEQMAGAALLRLSSTELYTYMLPDQEQGAFSNNALERLLSMPVTTRNWRVISQIDQLCRAA